MAPIAQRASELFEDALARAPEESAARIRLSRKLLGKGDSFDRVAPTQLLLETAQHHLDMKPLRQDPVILFLDFGGGGDGARAASALIALCGSRRAGGVFVHVAANTPTRGLGALVRTTLVDAGAGAGLSVEVVAHNKPLGEAVLSDAEIAELSDKCALIVSFAPLGSAALFGPGDTRLLEISHVCALTTPDPESLVADLPTFAAELEAERSMDGISFEIEVEVDDEGGRASFVELGRCGLGTPTDDARERLWSLIDNAKRRRYRALVTPMHGGGEAGARLVCPCRRMLERGGHAGVSTARIVPSGNRLVAAGRGRKTLF